MKHLKLSSQSGTECNKGLIWTSIESGSVSLSPISLIDRLFHWS